MNNKRPVIGVSPWAALAAGLTFYFADGKTFFLLALPVLAHELGHLLCLYLLGCRIRALKWGLSGLCIRYSGDLGQLGHATAALAGPIAGLIYAWLAARFGPSGELSAGISILLSVFNLIPALPLDGGRAAEALFSPQMVSKLSKICAKIIIVLGLLLLIRGKGAALFLAGLFLYAAQFRQGISSAMSPD